MLKKRTANQKGLTLVEVMVAMVIALLIFLGVGVVVADSHRSWNRMYNRVYSDVVTDSYVARKTFDAVIRKAGRNHIFADENGGWVEVRYYQDWESTTYDRYARFYVYGDELRVEYGDLDPGQVLSTRIICSNVSSCVFTASGKTAQMVLTLDNGSETATVMTSAVAHN